MIFAIPGIVSSLAATAGIGAAQPTLTPPTPAPVLGAQPMDFGQTLTQITKDAVGTLQNSEAVSLAGIQGKASVQQVVESVMSAERTLQTALAVRDKAVGAYQEISRMSI